LFQPLNAETKKFVYSCSKQFTITPVTRVLCPVYGSVTPTNAGNKGTILSGINPKMAIPTTTTKQPQHAYAVPNSNHFVYAKLNRADHAESVELDMLIGNKYALA